MRPGLERRLLDVDRPDLGALRIVQDGQVYSARDVVERELAGAAHVDCHVESAKRRGFRVLGDGEVSHNRFEQVACDCYRTSPPDL